MASLRSKIRCEICGNVDRAILHYHHIIPRCDPRCGNSNGNMAVLCPNCHASVHAGNLVIIGVYQTTDGRMPIWFKKGEDPPFPQEFWIVKENPLVVTIAGDSDDLASENCQ